MQKFPPPDSSLDFGGYSIAKFGNVVLTRSFPKMEIKPTPAEEGIKAFALCPFFVPTKLVTDEYKGLSVEEAKLKVEQEIRKESMGQVPYSTFAKILIQKLAGKHPRVHFDSS